MPTSFNIPGGKELIDSRALLEKAGIAEKMKVADFGCGKKGHFTLEAARLIGPQGIVYAVDILKSSLKSIMVNAEMFGIDNIKTVWADLEIPGSTKIPSSTVDFAMANNLLFQVKNHLPVFQEAYRILKKEGLFLVTDWIMQSTPFGPPVEARVSKEKVKEVAKSVGFKQKDEWKAGPYHWALLFIK